MANLLPANMNKLNIIKYGGNNTKRGLVFFNRIPFLLHNTYVQRNQLQGLIQHKILINQLSFNNNYIFLFNIIIISI